VRNFFAVFLALISLLLGTLLVYNSDFSANDLTETASVLGGAIFIALGLTIVPMVFKSQPKPRVPSRSRRDSGVTVRRP
jgi:hypothetical protein